MHTLREAKVGQTVKVIKLHGEGAVKRRIMDMGCLLYTSYGKGQPEGLFCGGCYG